MNTNSVSARKIGANLWEVEPPPQFNFNSDDNADPIHQRRRRQRSSEKQGLLLLPVSDQLHSNSTHSHPVTFQQEIESSSLRGNSAQLPSLHHLSVDKDSEELQQQQQQHISSASCCSSMQVTPYACAVTPTSYTLKTSTHLLKVLNRIWNLEEQHSRNTFLIKSLKRDLEISQAQIKTLVEERKMALQQIDELKRSTHERKQKVVWSAKDELLEIKSSFMQEKKARILLESLCDEFAKGMRDYEQKVRFLQQNQGDKVQNVSRNEPDRLILHVSEAWLDERAQMKCDFSEKTSISDNLCCEIEMFLEAKKKQLRGFEVKKDGIPWSPLVSRMIDRDDGRAEPSPKPMIDRGPGVTEASSRRAHEGVRSNTLMAKLVEARLESQFLKSRTVRR